MTNPYQPPIPKTEEDVEPRPVWRSALTGWLVGLVLGSLFTFPFLPWMHACLITMMVGASVSAIVQLRILVRLIQR